MTEEERSQRQQVFALIASARKKVNPTTAEHIAEVAKRNADDEQREYVEFLGWKHLVRLQEDDTRAHFRPTRSGHKNASGRYGQIRSILNMPERVGELAKDLGDLTLSELHEVITSYERRAQENQDEAERLQRIAAEMKKEGVQIVAELGEERVFGLYVGETSNA